MAAEIVVGDQRGEPDWMLAQDQASTGALLSGDGIAGHEYRGRPRSGAADDWPTGIRFRTMIWFRAGCNRGCAQ